MSMHESFLVLCAISMFDEAASCQTGSPIGFAQKDRYTVNDKNDTEWLGSTSLVTSQQSGIGAWVGKPELPRQESHQAERGKGHENWSQGHPVRCMIKLTRLYQRYQRHLVVSVFLLRIWVSMEDVRHKDRGTKAFSWVMSRRALRDPHCVWQPCCRLHCSTLDDSAWGSGFCSSSVGPDIPTKSYKARLMFRS